MTTEINSYQEFDEAFYGADGPIVCLFTAPTWCVPCRQLEPHWKKVVEALDGWTVLVVDLGASPEDTASHWATEEFGIRGVPTIYKWAARASVDKAEPVRGRTVVKLINELKD